MTTNTVTLTGPFGRLYVGEGDAIGSNSFSVDVALIGRDVNALGLSPLLEIFSRLNSNTGGSSEEEKRRCTSQDTQLKAKNTRECTWCCLPITRKRALKYLPFIALLIWCTMNSSS